MYRKIFKPIIDFIAALIILFIFSPIYLFIYLLLFIDLKGNPIFKQKRPGKQEKIFTIYKFRTMNNKVDSNGFLLPDNKRLTKIGKVIKSLSVDELPQLFNILKGDMSFIGPRPLMIEYLPYYTQEQKKRHSVLPGITGLAQVKGRNGLKFSKRFILDVEYVNNMSLILDMKILFQTFKNVVTTKNGNALDQFVEDYDDIGLAKDLPKNYERKQ